MLKLSEVYDFNVGDEFHIVDQVNNNYSGVYAYVTNYEMIEILNRQNFVTNDTVQYLIHQTSWNSHAFPVYTSSVSEDTIIVTYTGLNKFVSELELSSLTLPLSPVIDSVNYLAGYYRLNYDTICGRLTESYQKDLYWMQNSCFNFQEFGTGIPANSYIEGVGVASCAAENWDGCPHPWSSSTDFVYIKKGNCITGIPLNRPLADAEHIEIQMKIFPNPSTGIYNLNFGEENITELEVFNNLGQSILLYSVNSKEAVLNLMEFPQGIYLVRAKGNRILTGKLIK
jgi:hypothetical protein